MFLQHLHQHLHQYRSIALFVKRRACMTEQQRFTIIANKERGATASVVLPRPRSHQIIQAHAKIRHSSTAIAIDDPHHTLHPRDPRYYHPCRARCLFRNSSRVAIPSWPFFRPQVGKCTLLVFESPPLKRIFQFQFSLKYVIPSHSFLVHSFKHVGKRSKRDIIIRRYPSRNNTSC